MRVVDKKKALLIALSLLTFGFVRSQDIPLYNHYFSNPFFYNPSYSAANKQAEVSVLYRQQWTGIEGAPKFSNLTLTAPLSHKMGFGLNLYSRTRGVISTISGQVSLSYRVTFTEHTHLSFGLAAGVGRNTLDVNQVDPNDPAIARLLSNSFFLEGQAGLNLQLRNLNISLSMPQLFDRSIVDSQSLQSIGLSPLNTTIASISYKIKLSSTLSILPLGVSKITTKGNQWEAYGIAYYNDSFWLGGLYRQDYGSAGLLGFRINKVLQLSYSYEFPINQNSQLSFATHEFKVSLLFGREITPPMKAAKSNTRESIPRTNHYKKTHRRKY